MFSNAIQSFIFHEQVLGRLYMYSNYLINTEHRKIGGPRRIKNIALTVHELYSLHYTIMTRNKIAMTHIEEIILYNEYANNNIHTFKKTNMSQLYIYK